MVPLFWRRWFSSRSRQPARNGCRPAAYRPCLEALEGRTLPASTSLFGPSFPFQLGVAGSSLLDLQATTGDFNLDGKPDLFIVNHFITNIGREGSILGLRVNVSTDPGTPEFAFPQ